MGGFMKSNKIWDASEVALIIVDYQEEMFEKFRSSDPKEIELNMKFIINAAKEFKIPIVLSTVGVQMGVNKPTRHSLRKLIPDIPEIDRSNMNAWEDQIFLNAVKATGKKRLIFCALYTEICLTFPVIEALGDGFDITFPTDAVAGLTYNAHNTAVQRLIQAGAIPNTTLALVTELFRDWKSELATKARPLIVDYLTDFHVLELAEHMNTKSSSFQSETPVINH
jgi:nicotinamidase-related amidase